MTSLRNAFQDSHHLIILVWSFLTVIKIQIKSFIKTLKLLISVVLLHSEQQHQICCYQIYFIHHQLIIDLCMKELTISEKITVSEKTFFQLELKYLNYFAEFRIMLHEYTKLAEEIILYEIERVSLEEYLLIFSLSYNCMTEKYAEKNHTQNS